MQNAMSKQTEVNANGTNRTKLVETTNKETGEKKVVKVNLDIFASALNSKTLKSEKKERQHVYNYPADIPKELRNESEGKKFRQKMRKQLERHSNNIFIFAKMKDIEKLTAEIQSFDAFYKERFRVNDYSVNSITQSKDNEADIALMVQIIKTVKAS